MALMGGISEVNKGSRACACRLGCLLTYCRSASAVCRGIERLMYRTAWREAMELELDGHETTGTYESATPPKG